MTQPSNELFKYIAQEYFEPEMLAEYNEARYDDVELTEEEFKALFDSYKVVDTETSYVDGEPTETIVAEHLPTKTYWMGQYYHNSWDGQSYEEPYGDRIVQVREQAVSRIEWVGVEDEED